MKTTFQVRLFRSADDEEPFVLLPIAAKMPLGALIFAMQQAHVTSADYVTVRWEDPGDPEGMLETEFYHVIINGTHITYDRSIPDEEHRQSR